MRDTGSRTKAAKSDLVRNLPIVCGVALMCAAASGCRSLPPPAQTRDAAGAPNATVAGDDSATNTNALAKVVVHEPKPDRDFSLCQKLNPVWWFGNADEPDPPDWYRPGKGCRTFTWHLRNPCHNFTSYVIGIGDKRFTRVGRFPKDVANPNGGWNWAVCRYGWLRLPFVDYHRGRFEFYCGWRESGNFGCKLNLFQKKKESAKKPETEAAPEEPAR